MFRNTEKTFNFLNIPFHHVVNDDKKDIHEEDLIHYTLECGYQCNAINASERSFMYRFKLHCKICKSCNENMKQGKFKELFEFRNLMHNITNH